MKLLYIIHGHDRTQMTITDRGDVLFRPDDSGAPWTWSGILAPPDADGEETARRMMQRLADSGYGGDRVDYVEEYMA